MERAITFRPEDRQSRTTDPVGPEPVEAPVETQRWRPANFASFSKLVTPRRRDPCFSNPIARTGAIDPEASSFSPATWVMIAFAGALLGVATTLLLAGL